jgi:ribosome-binding factor A
MATERRILRLQQLILEVAAETIQREARDPALALISITRVKLTNDLSSVQVYWSSLGNEQSRAKTERALEGIQPLVQRRVGDGIRIRITPRLSFLYDPTLEHAQRLDTIFHKLREERGEDEPETDAETEPEVESGTGPDAS